MLVAYVLFPVKVLGPGDRIGIWLYGCNRRCKGCATPELQVFNSKKDISVEYLCEMVNAVLKKHTVDGITISGGEPFEQAEELGDFLEKISPKVKDILLYTGYTIEQIKSIKPVATEKILKNISVLIDGEYREEENHGHALKGSENQRIHYGSSEIRQRYEQYITAWSKRKGIQNFVVSDGIFTVGIPERGFVRKLEKKLYPNKDYIEEEKPDE